MSTPAETTALARRWRLEINMGTDQAPDWQLCPGITEFQWSAEPNIEDSTTYDTDGWMENTKTAQAWEVVVTFNRKVNEGTSTYSPVHEAIRLAFFEYGTDGLVHLRFMDRNGLPEAYEGRAIPTWAPAGGAATDLDQVEVTFTGTGPLEAIPNPLAGS